MMKRVLSVVFAAAVLVGLLSVFPVTANAASGMSVSQECVDRIKKIEGFHAIPYWDYGQWTVGFGTTCPSDKLTEYQTYGIPMEEAVRLMAEQLSAFEKSVNSFADKYGLTLTQGQFDALVSMTYNLGTGMLTNGTSRIYRAIMDGATGNDMILAFSVYCSAGGEFLPGLMRRRLVEANMYLNGEYGDYAPENYCYVLYDANGGTRDIMAQGYDCNLAAEPAAVPTYSGYTFVGWYTAASGGTKVTQLDETTDGMTLYAHWEKGSDSADTSKNVTVTVTQSAVNVRTGPGISYAICGGVFKDETLQITGVTVVDGVRWGQFADGWICLRYTNYAALTGDEDETGSGGDETDEIELPIKATVLNSNGVIVYNGPHTTYPQLKTLAKGTVIEITEVYVLFDVMWGKCADGWVQINLRLQLHDDQKLAHSFSVTINYSYLNVRSGPGTSYNKVTQLANGTVTAIHAVEYVGSVPWGRCDLGWINLDYTSFDATLLEQYRSHSYGDWHVSTQASCVTTGVETRKCSYCGLTETRETALGDHSYGDWYVSEQGNCSTPSQERRDCADCGAYETRTNALGDHSYGDWYETGAATCQSAGQERRDCLYCDSYETRQTELAEHDYGEWAVETESTCVTAGQEKRICQVCGSEENRKLALAEHSYGQWYETVTPTTETVGEERRDCQHCDAYETRELAVTEHTYGDWYVVEEATCEQEGLERRDCQHCEEYQTRQIEATGHDMSEWYILSDPTCTEEGARCRICQICQALQTEDVAALGHSFDPWIVLTEVTCTQDGEQCRVCAVCTYVEAQTIAATGHNYGNWVTVTQATCTQDGEQCRACVNCGDYELQTITALGHSMGAWYTVTEAVCGQNGQERRDCSVCGGYETREVVANEHSYGDWYVYQEAGCGVAGEERRTCSKCGYSESRVIEALSHSYTEWYIAKQATCTEEGQLLRACQNCGNEESLTLEALGHSYGQWYAAGSGQERRDCSVCGGYETRSTGSTTQTVTKVYGTVNDYYVTVYTGAGSDYDAAGKLFYGDRVEILEKATASGTVWGRIGESLWVCLDESLALETMEEIVSVTTTVYATVTSTVLNIRESASSAAASVGYLCEGDRVEILEQTTVSGTVWGRIDSGWICLTDSAELETVTVTGESNTQVMITVMGTVTYNGLYVRSGCGAGYSRVGSLSKGTYVEILEFGMSGSQVWGRIDSGWIRVDGYVDLEMIRQELIDGHNFGLWYTVTETTCTTAGQERRDCYLCGEYEVREVAATGHNFSSWTVVESATCVSGGVEARVCQYCMKSEIRTTELADHSYGDWYTVKEATATEQGQERRDCQWCESYETRVTDKVAESVTKTYGILVGYSYVNIRGGAGGSYSLLGQLQFGDCVQILEQATDSYGRVWGRISDEGWVCITGYLALTTVTEPGTITTVTKTYGTITGSTLNIRGGVGAGYDLLGVLYKGTKVEIFEQAADSQGRIWGRISDNGWVCLTGYVSLQTVEEEVDSSELTFDMMVNSSRAAIYTDADTTSTSVGYLIYGAQVEILEVKNVDGQLWVRILQGWIDANKLA